MKEKSYQSWSLVIMAYNEEQTIEKVSLKAVDFLSPLPEDKKEILIIDDGSFDGTFKKAKHLADTFSFIRVYRNEKKFWHRSCFSQRIPYVPHGKYLCSAR